MILRGLILAFLFSPITYPVVLSAQTTNDEVENSFRPGFGIKTAYAHNSFRAWGTMENTRQLYLNLSFLHTRTEFMRVPVELSSDLILTGWIRYPEDGIDGPRQSTTGLGIVPMRVILPLSNSNGIPFLSFAAGFIVMGTEFPIEIGTRFNYILEAGAGYRFSMSNQHRFETGLKLTHLSNGNTGMQNPGIDSGMIFISYYFPF
jgi:hypothetical protein